jgi:hypothetical protein
MRFSIIIASTGFLAFASAEVAEYLRNYQNIPLGISWPAENSNSKREEAPIDTVPKLPVLNLGYMKIHAAKYNFKTDIYKFRNVSASFP